MKRTSVIATVLAGFLLASAPVLGQEAASPPAHVQLQKTIGKSKADIVPSLFVLNSDGASLKDGKLTLDSVAVNSIVFADRPVRSAGHVLTAHILEEWAVGGDSFAKDPPNATVSAFSKDGATVRDAVVVLKTPKMDGNKLVFDVDVLEGSLDGADGPAAVFIDIIGFPRTPLSFAGVARRSMYRGAFYAGAALGAGAYYHPYYHPYYQPYAPPACGYYPYPPCY